MGRGLAPSSGNRPKRVQDMIFEELSRSNGRIGKAVALVTRGSSEPKLFEIDGGPGKPGHHRSARRLTHVFLPFNALKSQASGYSGGGAHRPPNSPKGPGVQRAGAFIFLGSDQE